MTCKCGSTRMMSVNGKCNDLAFTRIPHLNVEHDGYTPHLGVFGGDYVNITVCMDCGQIQNWIPITDDDVYNDDTLFPDGPPDEDVRSLSSEGQNVVRSFGRVHVQRFNSILTQAYGDEWESEPEARIILERELENYPKGHHEHEALVNLIERCK